MMKSSASTNVTGGSYVQLARFMAVRSLRWSWFSFLGEVVGEMNWIEVVGAILRISKTLGRHHSVFPVSFRWFAMKVHLQTLCTLCRAFRRCRVGLAVGNRTGSDSGWFELGEIYVYKGCYT